MNMRMSEEILECHGIRPTPVRVLVLELFGRVSDPVSALDIETVLHTVDRSSISRTLALFMESGLLHSINDGSGSVKYELCHNCAVTYPHEHEPDVSFLRHSDLHLHFHCTVCGKTECLPDSEIPSVSLPEGYVGHGANFVITGICASCAARRQ